MNLFSSYSEVSINTPQSYAAANNHINGGILVHQFCPIIAALLPVSKTCGFDLEFAGLISVNPEPVASGYLGLICSIIRLSVMITLKTHLKGTR